MSAPRAARPPNRYRARRRRRAPWGRAHWHAGDLDLRPGRERTPRVPHRFDRVPAEEGSDRVVVVQVRALRRGADPVAPS